MLTTVCAVFPQSTFAFSTMIVPSLPGSRFCFSCTQIIQKACLSMFITIADRLSDPWMLPFSRPRLHCHAKSTERKRHMYPNGSRRQIKGYEHGHGKAFRNGYEGQNRLPDWGRAGNDFGIAICGFRKLHLVVLYIEETRSEKVSKTAGELCLT